MRAQLHFVLRPLLAIALPLSFAGCDDRTPLAPELDARSAGSGPTLNAPSGANAVAGRYDLLNVSWQDNSSNESGFEVHRSSTGLSGTFTLVASLGANATSLGNTGLSGSTQYCYKIRAFRITGGKTSYSAFSNTACATTPAPPTPPAPSAVHARPLQSNWIEVTWTDNSTNETGFRLEHSATSSGPWTTVATTSFNVTRFDDIRSFAPDQAVCHRVFAVNSYGDSPASNVFCTALPAAPTNLTGAVRGDLSVDLGWTDNSAVEDGYEVTRSDDGSNWNIIATLPANATAYHDATVTPDATYLYAVLATRDGGSTDPDSVQVVTATTPPAQPATLWVRPQSSSSVYGTWVDQSSNEAGFRIERSTDGGASWAAVLTAATNDSSFLDQGLAVEQQVCYRVLAFNRLGDSPPSNTSCTAPPLAPTNLAVAAVDGMTLDFSWTDNSNVEDGFVLWVDDGCSTFCSFGPVAAVGPNTTTLRYQDQYAYVDGRTYYVVAAKDGGRSDFSLGVSPPPSPGSSSVRAGATARLSAPRAATRPSAQAAPAGKPMLRRTRVISAQGKASIKP